MKKKNNNNKNKNWPEKFKGNIKEKQIKSNMFQG